MNCENAVEYLSELNRMCNYYISKDSKCENCSMNALAGSFGAGSCELAARENPKMAVALVQEWSDENPVDIEFVSYDGEYPNLCSGELVLKINGEERNLGRCLVSGGCAGVDDNLDDFCITGEWSVDLPDYLKEYEAQITSIVNKNVRYGCCGGCI